MYEFGGCGDNESPSVSSWRDTFLKLVHSRSALHRANQSALNEFSSSVCEWFMQVSFVGFKADDDTTIYSTFIIDGGDIEHSKRPQSIVVAGNLKSGDQYSHVRDCKLWVKHLGTWKLIAQAPSFKGDNSCLDAWRWVNETGWSANDTGVDELCRVHGTIVVYIHYCELFQSLGCWRDRKRIPQLHLQPLAFPQQSSMPLFWLVMIFTASSDPVQSNDIWVPLGQLGGKSKEEKTEQTPIKLENEHSVLSVEKVRQYETADFCLFNHMGNILLGRSCVELWQRGDSGEIVLEFLEDDLHGNDQRSSRIIIDSTGGGENIVSLELTSTFWEAHTDLP